MTVSLEIFSYFIEPFSSPFFLVLLLTVIASSHRFFSSEIIRWVTAAGFTALFWIFYTTVTGNESAHQWMTRLNSPIITVLAILVLPAIFLPRTRWYPLFLIIPASAVLIALVEVVRQYRHTPADSGFAWFLMRPGICIAAFAGILVIAQYFLSLDHFRKLTRISILLLLLYGGFAFRQNFADYRDMLSRRQNATPDVMNIAETSPVMRQDNRLTYIPGAPCRFSADGGYVQGCVMELSQRIFQVNDMKIAQNDPVETAYLAVALAALLMLCILAFIGARWWCGWICPLATLGDIFDRIRRFLHLPHLKPSKPVKLTALFSGLSLATIGLVLAKAYAYIDENGKIAGCKIPVYPFCKICPGQMVCPVASQGAGALPPLPGMEWLFGFFRIAVIVLVLFFIVAFFTTRRLWCRFCPMGMFGGIFNRGAFLKLKKDTRKCNGCGVCNEVCPMDIHTVKGEMAHDDVSTFDCIYCMKCVDSCPQDTCLSLEFAGKQITESNLTRKLSP